MHCWQGSGRFPGIADARIQQAFQQPTLDVNVDRSLTSLAGLTEKDVATAMLTTLSGSSQSAPTYWLNPANGVSYAVSVQTPQRDINTMTGLKNIPVTSASAANTQLLGGLANVGRTNSNCRGVALQRPARDRTFSRRRRDAISAPSHRTFKR